MLSHWCWKWWNWGCCSLVVSHEKGALMQLDSLWFQIHKKESLLVNKLEALHVIEISKLWC
jgi:hypothetical protein